MQLFNRHMKKYSASLIIRETQIQTNMSYYFAPLRSHQKKLSSNTKRILPQFYNSWELGKHRKHRIINHILIFIFYIIYIGNFSIINMCLSILKRIILRFYWTVDLYTAKVKILCLYPFGIYKLHNKLAKYKQKCNHKPDAHVN